MTQYTSNSKCANVTIKRKKGDSFSYAFQVSICNALTDYIKLPVDLSAYNYAELKVRQYEYSDTLLTFSSTGATNTIDLSSLSSGQIHIAGAPITLNQNHYLYDLELSSSAITETVIAGKFVIDNEVTF